MDRIRLRIRFRKVDDLRWISHRDLVRAMERLFRRAKLSLRMSEGFHPKPRMSFPSALALGVEGLDEVMELELNDLVEVDEVRRRLNELAPPGLVITDVSLADASTGKMRVQSMAYRFPLPSDRREAVRKAVSELMNQPEILVARAGRRDPIDVRAGVEALTVTDGELSFRLSESHAASVRPRDLLNLLQLADLESDGYYLTRTSVELT
jgi:radical SAM-linked protein